MFWMQNVVAPSNIDPILEKEDVELEELLDEDDVLQECKAQNKKLIDYLIQPTIMDKMVNLIISEPDQQKVIKIRYKYSNIACEILTSDVNPITDALISQETLLNKLYSFLETEMPLNPLLASFFCKTMSMLLFKKNELLVEFLKSKNNFVDLILRHIEISAIAQLLLKFLTFSTMSSNILTWLNEQNIVQRLVSLINPSLSRDVNENAALLLYDAIVLSREHMSMMQEDAIPNPLLETIESSSVISVLINNTFNEKRNESVIVNGISVLMMLLEFRKYASIGTQQLFTSLQFLNHGLQPSNTLKTLVSVSPCNEGPEQMTVLDAERLSLSIRNTLDAIIPYLPDIHEALIDPPLKSSITLTTGTLDPPLGQSRLEIACLIAMLLSTNTHAINVGLAKSGTIFALLDLYFKYKWNNFLHTQVELIIKRIIMNPPTMSEGEKEVHPLLDQLFMDFQITKKILKCFLEQEQDLPETKNGYMGHLTKIANHIAESIDIGVNGSLIENALKDLDDDHYEHWKKFVDNTLLEINSKNNTPLIDMSNVNTSDPFAFNDKLIETNEALSDHINLAEVSFSNDVNIFQRPVNLEDSIFQRSTDIEDNMFQRSSDLEDNIFQKREELFEQICQEKCHTSSPTEEVDSDEDVWIKEEKEIPFIQQNCHNDDDDSSDSDEEKESPHSSSVPLPSIIKNYEIKNMDVESQNNWTMSFDSVPMDVTPMPVSNPWESADDKPSSTATEQENWADFSNFANFSSNSTEATSEICTSSTVDMDTSEVSNSKLISDAEVSSTSDVNVSPNKPTCDNFDTTLVHDDLISTTSKDCNKLSSTSFSSTEKNSDSNVSLIDASKNLELEQDNERLKESEATATGKPTSAIVENGPI